MFITVCNQTIDVQSILSVIIKDNEVLIDTTEDFLRIKYSSLDEITELKNWQKFSTLTRAELQEALNLLYITCEFFINMKDQCTDCPLKRKEGCVFTTIPIDWRT